MEHGNDIKSTKFATAAPLSMEGGVRYTEEQGKSGKNQDHMRKSFFFVNDVSTYRKLATNY